MISKTTPRFRRAFLDLPEAVQARARQAYRLFAADPQHSCLQFTAHAEKLFRERVSRGEEIVESMRSGLSTRAQPSVARVTDELDRLTRLRGAGSLTPDEFERLKARLIAGL